MFICKTLHGCVVTDYDKFEFMYSVRKFLATLFSFSAFSGSEAVRVFPSAIALAASL